MASRHDAVGITLMPQGTRPPDPRTGFSLPSCYASPLADCDETLSREHFISKSLLLRLGKTVAVQGTIWSAEPRIVGVEALTARILCKRHNEALSGLDTHITELFDAFAAWHRGETIGDREIDGDDIERWALKAMLGYLTSGNVAHPSGTGSMRARAVPESYLRVLFGEDEMPEGGGLYLLDGRLPGQRLPGGISLSPALAEDDAYKGLLVGLAFSIANVSFLISLVEVQSARWYRPNEIELAGSGRLLLRYSGRSAGDAYVLTHADSG